MPPVVFTVHHLRAVARGARTPAKTSRIGEAVVWSGAVRSEDLPIERPSKFELVLNLRTAKVLGLSILPGLLLRADEVIE